MPAHPGTNNALYYGDNLQVLRDHFRDETVDLIYLDPPFNSSRSYNVLFRDESGSEADAQIQAFDDTWHWGKKAEDEFVELMEGENQQVARMISAMRSFIGENQMMAYLVMMANRLVELHRVLKLTGSLYLHCDPTASHYLKLLLDTIFGPQNFRNEITWKRQSAHNDARRKFAGITDSIFYYVRSDKAEFNVVRKTLDNNYVDSAYRYFDEAGRRYRLSDLRSPNPRPNLTYDYKGYKPHRNGWAVSFTKMEQLDREGRLYFPASPNGRIQLKRFLDENKGQAVPNLWDDILPLHGSDAELLGYPTQKPLAILERIIQASSNLGDLLLDPFSGCGTAITAAQKLGRAWAGIDITHLAITMHKSRLKDMFGLEPVKDYQVIGEPQDLGSARQLAREDRYQFQWWALSLVHARPIGGSDGGKTGKKGSDRGIDGVIPFPDGPKGEYQRVIVQVKSGGVKSGDIRDLRGVLEREKDAPIGVFITLEAPSKEMVLEAVSAGNYLSELWGRKYPRVQILTVEELLAGGCIQMPPAYGPFKKAEKVVKQAGMQAELGL